MVVKEAPYTSPGENEVVVKNKAVAMNPVDHLMQDYGVFIKAYPMILGTDIAGEVVEIGEGVADFKVGDRVIGHCSGLATGQTTHNAFQSYTVIPTVLVAKIPSSLSFTMAVVLPLAISTASAGLFQKDNLGLDLPSVSSTSKPNKAVLVWGGASSVGSTAIQLAKFAGYKVYTTASSHNFGYVKNLGASEAFDYKSKSVVEDIVSALKKNGDTLVGAYDAASKEDTVKAICEILAKSDGELKLATVLPETPGWATNGVKVSPVFAPTIAGNEVGPAVWKDFLPGVLESGKFEAKPDASVVGKGLDKVQEGINKLKAGASATKYVIEL